jgi:hypothetical protein
MAANPPSDDTVQKIRRGKNTPIEERQERWDRVQAWSKPKAHPEGRPYSLAEIATMEWERDGEPRDGDGNPVMLSRERIRAIKERARPGTVGRPQLPGLRARAKAAEGRLILWKSKPKTPFQTEKVAEAKKELAEARKALRAEERRVAREAN